MLPTQTQYLCPTKYNVRKRMVITVAILVLLGVFGSLGFYKLGMEQVLNYSNSLELNKCHIDIVQNETYTIRLVGTNITIVTDNIYPYYTNDIVDCWFKPPDKIFMPDNPVAGAVLGYILGFAGYILIILVMIGYAIIRELVRTPNDNYEQLA